MYKRCLEDVKERSLREQKENLEFLNVDGKYIYKVKK